MVQVICIQSSNALQGNQASLFPNQNGRSVFGLKCFWIQQTKPEKVLIHQVLSSSKVFGFDSNIWTSKNGVSISRWEPLKKNKWNILEPHVKFAVSYGHLLHWQFPPHLRRGATCWRAQGFGCLKTRSCELQSFKTTTEPQNKIVIFPRGSSTRLESPLPEIPWFVESHSNQYKEKLAQETFMYKAFTENFGTAWGTSLFSATTAIHIDRWKNIYAKITLPFPAHFQNLQKFIAYFYLAFQLSNPVGLAELASGTHRSLRFRQLQSFNSSQIRLNYGWESQTKGNNYVIKKQSLSGFLPPLRKQVTGLENRSTWFVQWFKVEATADFAVDDTSDYLSEQ